MDIAKIKSKLQKLLALSASDNEAEAGLAMAKASELMEKYGLRTIDVEADTKDVSVDSKSIDGLLSRREMWEVYLARYIADAFDGEVISEDLIDEESVFYKKTGWRLVFVAGKSDIEIITDLYTRVRRIISFKAKAYAKTYVGPLNKKSVRLSYARGMGHNVRDRLKKMREQEELLQQRKSAQNYSGTKDLIVVKTDAVAREFKAKFPTAVTRKQASPIRSGGAYETGYKDGDSIGLGRSLNGGGTTAQIA